MFDDDNQWNQFEVHSWAEPSKSFGRCQIASRLGFLFFFFFLYYFSVCSVSSLPVSLAIPTDSVTTNDLLIWFVCKKSEKKRIGPLLAEGGASDVHARVLRSTYLYKAPLTWLVWFPIVTSIYIQLTLGTSVTSPSLSQPNHMRAPTFLFIFFENVETRNCSIHSWTLYLSLSLLFMGFFFPYLGLLAIWNGRSKERAGAQSKSVWGGWGKSGGHVE